MVPLQRLLLPLVFSALLCVGCERLRQAEEDEELMFTAPIAVSRLTDEQLVSRLRLNELHRREAREANAPVAIYVGKLARLCTTHPADPRCTPELMQYGVVVQAGDARARARGLNEAERAQLDLELIEAFDALSARGDVTLEPAQAAALARADAHYEEVMSRPALGHRDRRLASEYRARTAESRRRDELLLARRDYTHQRRVYRQRLMECRAQHEREGRPDEEC